MLPGMKTLCEKDPVHISEPVAAVFQRAIRIRREMKPVSQPRLLQQVLKQAFPSK